MRLTYKKFAALVQQAFDRLEITGYEVVSAERTRFRGQDYEAGAATIYVRCQSKEHPDQKFTMFCFSWLSEVERMVNEGYKISIDLRRSRYSLSDAHINFIKP